jgi:hypothetical protein
MRMSRRRLSSKLAANEVAKLIECCVFDVWDFKHCAAVENEDAVTVGDKLIKLK